MPALTFLWGLFVVRHSHIPICTRRLVSYSSFACLTGQGEKRPRWMPRKALNHSSIHRYDTIVTDKEAGDGKDSKEMPTKAVYTVPNCAPKGDASLSHPRWSFGMFIWLTLKTSARLRGNGHYIKAQVALSFNETLKRVLSNSKH